MKNPITNIQCLVIPPISNLKIKCLVFFLLLGSFVNSQNQVTLLQSDKTDDPFIRELDSNLTQYSYHNPVEKVYLQTDRVKFYLNKEHINSVG